LHNLLGKRRVAVYARERKSVQAGKILAKELLECLGVAAGNFPRQRPVD
jgi:hypothetical protein